MPEQTAKVQGNPCEEDIGSSENPLAPLERPNYFHGQILTDKDFRDEQEYFLQKSRRHNMLLHGWGVVCGLRVKSGQPDTLTIHPGFALDCAGNEIAVPNSVEVSVPAGRGSLYVVIRYREHETSPVPTLGTSCDSEEKNMEFSRITEGFEITCEPDCPSHKHIEGKSRIKACGVSHGIPLAQLRFRRGRWGINPWFFPPRIECGRPLLRIPILWKQTCT